MLSSAAQFGVLCILACFLLTTGVKNGCLSLKWSFSLAILLYPLGGRLEPKPRFPTTQWNIFLYITTACNFACQKQTLKQWILCIGHIAYHGTTSYYSGLILYVGNVPRGRVAPRLKVQVYLKTQTA